MDIAAIFKEILSLSFAGSVVAVIILLVKGLLKNKLTANWHYYIWLLLIIRLVIPYAPSSSFSIFNLLNPTAQSIGISSNADKSLVTEDFRYNTGEKISENIKSNVQFDEGVEPPVNHGAISSQKKSSHIISYETLGIIWLFGAVSMMLYILVANNRLSLRITTELQCDNEKVLSVFKECKSKFHIKRNIQIIYDEYLKTPSIVGVIKPRLLVSYGILDKLSEEEKRYIFLHELAHYKRKDLLINWLMVIVQALHWFNPLVWYCFYKTREDCEAACDAYVLKRLETREHKSYGETIINLVDSISKPHWRPVAIGMSSSKSGIKRRIRMIAKFEKGSRKWAVIAFVLLLGIIFIGMTDGYDSPKINITAEIRSLTEEEYSEVGTKEIDNPTIDDFMKFTLDVSITKARSVKSKIIEVPDYGKIGILLNNNEVRLWYANSSDQNNKNEDFALANREIIIYTRGLSETEIRKRLKPAVMQLGWIAKDGKEIRNKYSIGDILNFNDENKSTEDILVSKSKITPHNIVNNFNDVNMTVKKGTASSTGLTLVFQNDSDKTCTYGEAYWLEKKINGKWYQAPVAIEEGYAFNSIGYEVAKGQVREWKVDWQWLYGSLDDGDYRIVKNVLDFRKTGDYDTYLLAAEFSVNTLVKVRLEDAEG